MSISAKLFSFEGRIGRTDWWLFSLLIFAFQMAVVAALWFAVAGGAPSAEVAEGMKPPPSDAPDLRFGQFLLWMLVPFALTLWPSLALQVKRWHDRDKGAVWLLVQFIPYVGPLWTLVELGFLAGTPGGNRFGDGAGAYERIAAVFDEVEADSAGRAAAAVARWQAEAAAPAAPAWAPPPRPAGPQGFGRRGLAAG